MRLRGYSSSLDLAKSGRLSSGEGLHSRRHSARTSGGNNGCTCHYGSTGRRYGGRESARSSELLHSDLPIAIKITLNLLRREKTTHTRM